MSKVDTDRTGIKLMGWRFRRQLRVIPGLTLNVGKRTASVSIGGRGARVTYGRRGKRATIGLPGTGLSYSIYEPYHRTDAVRWGLILMIITVMLILLAVIGSKP
jgi:hypothetical protein